jgi:hypothetical protein
MAITRGLLFPSVTLTDAESGKNRPAFHLLPRFRRCVDETADQLGISKVLDSAVTRGMKAMWNWLTDTLRSGRNRLVDAATPEKSHVLPPPTS